MNSQDWHEGMVRNQEWEVKRQAKLDVLYEQERAKYSKSTSNSQASNNSNQASATNTRTTLPNYFGNACGQNNFNNGDVNARLDKLEARIDKLYELIGTKHNNYTSDGMFVIAPKDATVFANQSFTLTDEQFKTLMSQLIND